ncbi:MAG TPA: hypothetical protein VGP16_24775, partial [Asanoa sp.]|nr:hypothetical protein [Asanoa sp.]
MWRRRLLAALGLTAVTAVMPACVGGSTPETTPAPAGGSAATTPDAVDGVTGLGGQPSPRTTSPAPRRGTVAWTSVRTWVYQLQGYQGDRLDAVARTPGDLAVIDLARDAKAEFFRAEEIKAVRAS